MIVTTCDVTRLTTGFRRVLRMDFAAGGGNTQFMTIRTGRFPLHIGFAIRFRAVSMKLPRLVAIQAFHPLFKMDVSDSGVSSGILRINAPAVAGGAGFFFISFLESVVGEKSLLDAGNGRRSDVAVSATGMARPAGLLKYFCVKLLRLCRGKTLMDAFAQTGCRVVQRFCIMVGDPFVAWRTGFDVFRRLRNHPLVGVGFIGGLRVALVAFRTAAFQMNIFGQTFLRNQKSFIGLRNPRRRSGSPIASLARGLVEIIIENHCFQQICVAMTSKTCICCIGVRINFPGNYENCEKG